MRYSKLFISKLSNETNFINYNLEKVLRLLDVLEFIFTKSSFADVVVLKGGTAINLLHTNLKRLSVDIDLDYQGTLDREQAFLARDIISKELDEYMSSEEYNVSPRSRGSVALFSRIYQYTNAYGNIDYIKVEINFMDRISVYPTTTDTVNQFGKIVKVKVPSKEELYGMKLCALIDRNKPRDLYDSNFLFNNFFDLDVDKLRKCVIFYLSLDGRFNIDDELFENIKSIDQSSIKKELQPVLEKGSWFNLKEMIEFVINHLKHLLVLNENEKSYLLEFSKGNYVPSLLFDEEISSRAILHPMAKWKLLNIKK